MNVDAHNGAGVAGRRRQGGFDLPALERRAIARAKDGDWDAIHFLYARYADEVFRFVRNIVRNHHEAEDITQDVFARLHLAIRRYEERDASFRAWILRVARNATLDQLRGERQIPVGEVRLEDRGDEPMERERVEALREALRRLPDEQREVLILRHVIGLSPSEIAIRLGKTEGSIHGLHHRGRAALQLSLVELEAAPVTLAVAV